MRANAAASQRITGSFQISGSRGSASRFLENALGLVRTGPVIATYGYASHRDSGKGKGQHHGWLSVQLYACNDSGEVQMHIGSAILVIWLIIGGFAAGQRGDYTGPVNCSTAATAAVTILAGALNYVGVNPRIDCTAPSPSN
jgi:hypothetical protein